MTSEYLLEAVGLLDDDLILQAERAPGRRPVPWQQWLGLCACLAIVFLVGRGMVQNWGGGTSGNTSAGGGAEPSAGASGSASASLPDEWAGGSASTGEQYDAIMVDGAVYWSTGKILVGEVDPGAIRETTSRTDGVPEVEGQTNFAPPGTRYAVTADGVVVLIDREWVLFSPIPPWQEG